jgi:hypothetical protein
MKNTIAEKYAHRNNERLPTTESLMFNMKEKHFNGNMNINAEPNTSRNHTPTISGCKGHNNKKQKNDMRLTHLQRITAHGKVTEIM